MGDEIRFHGKKKHFFLFGSFVCLPEITRFLFCLFLLLLPVAVVAIAVVVVVVVIDGDDDYDDI